MTRIFVTVLGAALLNAAQAADKLNIVFIMADDMGYADAGCFGGEHVLTPNIDKLAAGGMRFTDCYAGSTVCAPSRSVLMTGLHTGHTRVRGNFGKGGVAGLGGGKGRVPLRDEDVTVAEVLKEAGYVTGITGKWGLGEPDTGGEPNRQGFDEWFGYLNQRRAHSYYPDFIWKDQKKFPLPGNTAGKKGQYTHDLFTEFALDFIGRHAGGKKPFFLYVPYTIPHAKFEVPSLEPYTDKKWPKEQIAYAAMVTRMDGDVGKIMKLLEREGADSSTLVFFCSDNGAQARYEGGLNCSGALRGRKRDMFEGGLRTPMIARWPGKIKAGAVSDLAWTFADFLPTAAALAGLAPPAGIDGISVVPTLLGESQDLSDRFLYWEFFERGYQQAARWRDWKAIRKKPGGDLELFDLKGDLGESRDISKKHPNVVAKFEKYLASARTKSEAWPIPR